MNPDRIKHLEFLQAVVTRMGGNSFLIKGWTVTLVAALFALAAKETQHWFAIVSLLPALCFWGLDAFYLRQERLFRKLFDAAAAPNSKITVYSMNTSSFDKEVPGLFGMARSKTLLPFYAPIVFAALIATYLTWSPSLETNNNPSTTPQTTHSTTTQTKGSSNAKAHH